MIWKEIISFTDKNVPYRFNVSTLRPPNSGQCKVTVQELDESDKKIQEFDFVYDVELNMPEADFKLHNKPIQTLIAQMLSINDDAKTW